MPPKKQKRLPRSPERTADAGVPEKQARIDVGNVPEGSSVECSQSSVGEQKVKRDSPERRENIDYSLTQQREDPSANEEICPTEKHAFSGVTEGETERQPGTSGRVPSLAKKSADPAAELPHQEVEVAEPDVSFQRFH